MLFKEFQEFNARLSEKDESPSPSDSLDSTAEQRIQEAHHEHIDGLTSELLDTILAQPFSFFEKMVVDLLLAMGYGGSREDAGDAIGRSGDERN